MLKNWWHFLNFVQKSTSVKMCFNIVNLKYNKYTSLMKKIYFYLVVLSLTLTFCNSPEAKKRYICRTNNRKTKNHIEYE